MLVNVLRATCDRCGATVEAVGDHGIGPDETDLVRANVGWTVFDMKFYVKDALVTSKIKATLCPGCVVQFNEFLAGGCRDE